MHRFSMERFCVVSRKKILSQHHRLACLKWLQGKYFGSLSALSGSSAGTPGKWEQVTQGCGENFIFGSAVGEVVPLMVIWCQFKTSWDTECPELEGTHRDH